MTLIKDTYLHTLIEVLNLLSLEHLNQILQQINLFQDLEF